MRLQVVYDQDIDADLDSVIDFYLESVEPFFKQKDYGEAVKWIGIVLMCRDVEVQFKQRKRRDKSDASVTFDVILEYRDIIRMSAQEKLKHINERVMEDAEKVLGKYKFADFDTARFLDDLRPLLIPSK